MLLGNWSMRFMVWKNAWSDNEGDITTWVILSKP